ncbi:hypothetical protein E9993_08125 [Labilibacter sediminis]|nr:hypothetical protein E9993_08125 [Labilibacter sediminis]
MNKAQFVEFLNYPDLASEQTLTELKEIIEEYPFFQIGRMLLLKNLHHLDNIRYNSELKHSSVYIPDRSKLYSLINNIHKPENEKLPPAKAQDDVAQSVEEEIVNEVPIQDISPEKPKPVITITDNYLNASDEFTGDDGNIYNFSTKEEKLSEEDSALQDIVLPAADLLDYELSTSTGYSLPQLDEIEDINPNENRSFSDWLHVMRYSSSPVKEKSEKKTPKGMNLIDNFLSAKPKIITAPSSKTKEVDLSEQDTKHQDDILTETLADIYIKQGYKSKAISILEKLLLKYPEKNAYFARRISDLKEN